MGTCLKSSPFELTTFILSALLSTHMGGNWEKSFGISTVATKGDDDTDPLTLIGNGVGGQRERGILLDGYWIDRSGRFG